MKEIDYTVRISRRARHARIVVRPNMRVEVVLPGSVPQAIAGQRAAMLMQEKQAWVKRTLKRFGEEGAAGHARDANPIPCRIDLKAIGMVLDVSCRPTAAKGVRVAETDSELHISGAVHDEALVRAGLQRWLKQKAKAMLPEVLDGLSHRHGFRYRKVTIRLQKSRWGSCSRAGNISLNAKLLFLPPELMRYVMLHELAHLKRMDHSPAFWSVVAQCDADYLRHRSQMRHHAFRIPAWAEE